MPSVFLRFCNHVNFLLVFELNTNWTLICFNLTDDRCKRWLCFSRANLCDGNTVDCSRCSDRRDSVKRRTE